MINFNNDNIEEYAFSFIKNIVNNFGGRAPGSKKEEAAAKVIEEELRKFCDETSIEYFEFHSGAFLGFIPLVLVFYLLSISLFKIIPIISFIFAITGFIILFQEFFRYREFIDPLFPKRSSQNVIGKMKAEDQLDKIIIVSGHHDSAYEFRLLRISPILYLISVVGSILSAYLLVILNILWAVRESIKVFASVPNILNIFDIVINYIWLYLVITIPIILPMFFFKSDEAVPGAVDNLSAVGVMLSVAKTLSENPDLKPKNTEVWFVSFGSEEEGLRGSRRFIAEHLDELKSVETYVINMDMIAKPEALSILIREKTTGTTHSMKLAEKLRDVAKKIGIDLKLIDMPFFGGGTDATSFSRAKIDAVTLSTLEYSFEILNYYHTRRDLPDKINSKALKIAHDIVVEFIKEV